MPRYLRTIAPLQRQIGAPVVSRQFATCHRLQEAHPNLPRVADPSLWRGMVPKALRRQQPAPEDPAPRAHNETIVNEKNPGLPLIILGLLAGSFAINIISLRREMTNFSRKTETKLDVLREVIRKVKNGEDVDVKRLLGTGDPQSEQEWEEVIRELETTDMLEVGLKKKAEKRDRRAAQRAQSLSEQEGTTTRHDGQEMATDRDAEQSKPKFMM